MTATSVNELKELDPAIFVSSSLFHFNQALLLRLIVSMLYLYIRVFPEITE